MTDEKINIRIISKCIHCPECMGQEIGSENYWCKYLETEIPKEIAEKGIYKKCRLEKL